MDSNNSGLALLDQQDPQDDNQLENVFCMRPEAASPPKITKLEKKSNITKSKEKKEEVSLPAINSHKKGRSHKFEKEVDPAVVESPNKLDVVQENEGVEMAFMTKKELHGAPTDESRIRRKKTTGNHTTDPNMSNATNDFPNIIDTHAESSNQKELRPPARKKKVVREKDQIMQGLSAADFIDRNNYQKKPRSELGGLSLTDINQLNSKNKSTLMNYAKVI